MRSFYIAALCIFLAICTPSMSFTFGNSLQDYSVELNEVMTSAFAAYKIANLLNRTSFKPNGKDCWICTILVSTLEKAVAIQNATIDNFIMKDLCPKVPLTYRPICQEIVNQYGPSIINAILNTESPDAACATIGYCGGDLKECKLFPKGEEPPKSFSPDWAQYFQGQLPKIHHSPDEWLDRVYTRIILDTIGKREESSLATYVNSLTEDGINPLDWLKELINKISTNHSAIVDIDNDLYSQTSAELRGYNWRGRDCDDTNADIHPGRKTNPQSGVFNDFNCNGIKGINTTTGQNYKDELCANSGQIGIVVMGDSAGAHCEVPTQWVNATQWQNYTWEDLVQSLADELDLPQMSAYTAYVEEGYHGPASSVYKYMYQRNKCNFRDYQNIAVNGLSSRNAQPAIIRIARSQTEDFPVLVFLELIGNDVCGHHEDFDHWTTVDDFRTSLIGILDTLDTLVPPGSHLVALGLANGSLIFEGVNGRTHPVGVTYNQFYDFMNCLNASLCWGWLNTNETIRQLTTQRAAQLSEVYSEVFSNYTAKNYDFIYYDFPTNNIFANWIAAGNDPYLLIEPVDGFHPSQIFNSMLSDYIWESLLRDRPNWLGSENPNNDRITQLFGDQGGY